MGMDDHQVHTESQTEKPQPIVTSNPEVNFFASTNFRNQNRKFGIKIDDRRRHMYVVGKTGMGKTTLLENMVLNDIYAGHGIGLVDPHGDFAEKIIDYIPSNRINDVVYFNPADINYPIGFNILETIRPEQKHLVASGLMGVFKKIWPDVWSARMEYILNNTILALLDFPGTTLLGINRMLAEEDYRKRVVNNSKDPVVKAFWQNEFASYTEKFRTEAVAPIQNKIGQFLSASVIRNIVAQVKSRINIREIMDERKIFIMNLSKGRIGEDNSRLLGGMLITRLQLAAMERVDIVERDRKDFFLYVDEFQNFAGENFAHILSEARKYRLDLVMAHQYMEQLDETVMAAVIGNVGTIVTFRVGSTDAEVLAKEYTPTFTEEDLVNLPKFQIYLKLMIDGVASRPFSATTLAPIAASTHSTERVVKVSRERYAVPREKIEDKIMRWSGLMTLSGDEAAALGDEDDDVPPDDVKSTPITTKPLAPASPRAVEKVPATSQPQPVSVASDYDDQAEEDEPLDLEDDTPTPTPTLVSVVPSQTSARAPQSAPQSSNAQPRRDTQRAPSMGQTQSQNQNQNQNQLSGEGKRKRKRKRKNRGGNPNPGQGESVLLVDPTQKGISLSAVLGKPMNSEQKTPERERSVPPKQPEVRVPQPIVAPTSSPTPTITPVIIGNPTPHEAPVHALVSPVGSAALSIKPEKTVPPIPPTASVEAPPEVKRLQTTHTVSVAPRERPAPSTAKTIPPGKVVKIDE